MPKYQQILLLVSTGVFMSTMDSSMVNVALPTLMRVFASSLAATEWVVLIYLLTITVSLLFWGYFSSRIGQGLLYTRGLLIFSIGSLCCSLAPSIFMLIFFRFVQAIGASMMMAMGPALIKSSFPEGRLGQGLGMIGIATSLGLMTGPAVSGVLLRWSHWRFIFLVTVPVGLLVYFAFRNILAAIGGPIKRGTGDGRRGFDLPGGLLYAGAVIITILLLAHATKTCCQANWHGWPLYRALVVLLVWLFFIVHELRKKHPLFPVSLFRNRFYAMAMVSAMLSFTVLFFVLLLMPFYLSSVRRFPPDQVGYFMMAVPLCVFFVAPLAGRLHDIIGARIIASVGLACCLISLLFLTRLSVASSGLFIVSALALLGFGQAMFLAPNSAAALAGVPHEESGITSSLLATSRNMGMLLGTALAGFVFARVYGQLTGGMDIKDFTSGQTAQFIQALQQTFKTGALLGVLAVSASWLRGRPGKTN
ncbi:MAG TPA: MFS transporter [Desulfobulbaceae bacterium]|nr:MFS transporter [Desulfobulbaceae bacterium]